MQGRVFYIKKTTILSISFYSAIISIAASTLLTILLMKNYYIWFDFFCLFSGMHLLIKSMLFRLDSCCYFGSTLFFIGAFGLLIHFLSLFTFQEIYYMLAFSFSSFVTYCFFKQKFQLLISLILFFAALLWFFYKINVIPLWIFIAFLVSLVLLFVVKHLIKNFARRS